MTDTTRISNICGSVNSMYYVDPIRPIENRIIRVEGVHLPQMTQLEGSYTYQNFNQQIVISSFVAWILLFISVIFSACVPCWLLADVKSQGFTRNAWRFLVTSVFLLPFVFYEQRHAKSQNQYFLKQLTQQKLKPIFISSINFCIWLLCLIYACRHTSMNHAVCLSCMRFFLVSAIRIQKGEKIHEFQIAGCILCTIGIILILSDSLLLSQSFEPGMDRYRRIQPWKRLLFGDSLGIIASFISVYLDQNHVVPDMPKFSYLLVYNLFLSFNLITFGYFFGGSQFTLNPKFGVFGLFTFENFVSVFYVSVMLGLYLIIANILISQIFNDVIINVGMAFQLIICSIIWHLLDLQHVPSGMTCLGYAFLTPGMIFAIGGQGTLQGDLNSINFQLYRPTQLNQTFKTGVGHPFKNSPNQRQRQKSQYLSNKRFQSIVQQDEKQIGTQRQL